MGEESSPEGAVASAAKRATESDALEREVARLRRWLDVMAELGPAGGWELDLTTMEPHFSRGVYDARPWRC